MVGIYIAASWKFQQARDLNSLDTKVQLIPNIPGLFASVYDHLQITYFFT